MMMSAQLLRALAEPKAGTSGVIAAVRASALEQLPSLIGLNKGIVGQVYFLNPQTNRRQWEIGRDPGADIAIALAEGAAIARTQADLVVTGRGLGPVLALFHEAPRVRRIIRQNLSWALVYNICALPLAAAGLVPPWAAAIGMSASSLGVVLNARRLGRGGSEHTGTRPGRGLRAVEAGT